MRRALLCALLLPLAASASWPQWRGPTRDSLVTGGPWPAKLTGLTQTWRAELGEGYPGPVVSADRVFVAETKGGKDEVVRCLDRKTGKQVWEYSWAGSLAVPFFARANGSWIRATPALDGDALYVAGIRDVVVCLDAATGKERWRADLMERYKTPVPAFGFVSSPLIDGDALYVQAAASFRRLDKKTGATAWRALKDGGGMYGSTFSSPAVATLGGRRQILVQTRTTLAGVNPEDGAVLWSKDIPATRGMNILTPTAYQGGVFTSAHGAKTYRFDVKPDGDKLGVAQAWDLNVEAYMSSPVVIGKHAYLHLRNQRFACVDLETGKAAWTTPKAFGKYWSMVAQGDKILALDERGVLYLIRATPDRFELLDEKKVSAQECWGHLAVSGDELFVRELKGVTAWKWK
ncbi:MAG: PQQ-binding-like beta-propeller repeat protein [Gemmataceae bacterium]